MNQNFSTIQQLAQHFSTAKPPPPSPPAEVVTPPRADGHYKNMHILDIREHTKKILGRLLIVGDVHGCPEQLEQLLQSINFVQGIDQLVIAGDFVNKGPDSIGAVEKAMEYGALGVLGNHDWTLLDIHAKIASGEIQPFNKKNARDPFVRIARDIPDMCIRYLSSLPHVLRIPQYNLMVVHAGLNPSYPLIKQSIRDLTHIRRLEKDPETNLYVSYEGGKIGQQWATAWDGPETVIFGHDARSGLQVEPHAFGLDTGCCYGGNLTGILFPGAKLVSVPGVAKKVRPPDDEEAEDPTTATPTSVREVSPVPSFPLSTPILQLLGSSQRNGTPSSSSAALPPASESFPNVPNVQRLFENARRSNVVPAEPALPSQTSSRMTPPSPAAELTSSSSAENLVAEFASLSALVDGQCAGGVLLLLKSAHYERRFLDMLAIAADDTTKRLVWSKVLSLFATEVCRKGGDDASDMIRFVVDILDGRPQAASEAVIEKLHLAAASLDGGAATGVVPKGVVKSLKLTLRGL